MWIQGLIKPEKMFGIDVSHHNDKIDWSKVAQNNPKVDFVYIKTSTGVGSADPRALYNATEARKNGIKIGYYHYCSLNDKNEIEDATAEANWFTHILQSLPTADLPAVLDIEDQNPTVHLEDGEVENWIMAFFETLVNNGIKDYVIYSYSPFLNEHLPADHGFGYIKLWVADYTLPLKLPIGWSSYWLWQYTAKGTISGISTDVDLNKQ